MNGAPGRLAGRPAPGNRTNTCSIYGHAGVFGTLLQLLYRPPGLLEKPLQCHTVQSIPTERKVPGDSDVSSNSEATQLSTTTLNGSVLFSHKPWQAKAQPSEALQPWTPSKPSSKRGCSEEELLRERDTGRKQLRQLPPLLTGHALARN
ncbi:hypothetical protein TREES_T100007892 [Tupaia chinensis]|uniref:Uncharacterized protein n=1 Tax=Tupaia chinensis TaxID=246437 RepID=L9JDR5_TUPCH|nr:hypothetical protein TREES_T100007892 [Tupaia chinensis]